MPAPVIKATEAEKRLEIDNAELLAGVWMGFHLVETRTRARAPTRHRSRQPLSWLPREECGRRLERRAGDRERGGSAPRRAPASFARPNPGIFCFPPPASSSSCYFEAFPVSSLFPSPSPLFTPGLPLLVQQDFFLPQKYRRIDAGSFSAADGRSGDRIKRWSTRGGGGGGEANINKSIRPIQVKGGGARNSLLSTPRSLQHSPATGPDPHPRAEIV